MQDIIPPYKSTRGKIRPPVRPTHSVGVARPEAKVFYARRSQVVNDMVQTTEVIEIDTPVTAVEPAPMTRGIEHLSPEAKALALERALGNAERELRREKRKHRDLKRFGLVFVASVFVLVTGYVSIDTWMTNNRVKAETSGGGTSLSSDGSQAADTKHREGKDETQPSAELIGSYAVAGDLPKTLTINKLNVHARVMPMSVNNDGSVQAPFNIFDAGWYNGSVKPGEIGAAFIDGHASGPTRQGLFAYLDTLKKGDTLRLETGDGTAYKYKVLKTEVIPLAKLDMKKALLPQNGTLKGLNLMTCTGEWLSDQQTYDHRVLVYTAQV